MNRPFEWELSEKLALLAAFVAAVAIAGGGLYFVLQKATPIAAPSKTTNQSTQTTLPASGAQTPTTIRRHLNM